MAGHPKIDRGERPFDLRYRKLSLETNELLSSQMTSHRLSSCYLHHARRGQHREEQVESSDVSSNTKKRMQWSAISQCRLRRLRLQPSAHTSPRLRSEKSSSSSM